MPTYVYKKPSVRLLMHLYDIVGSLFMRKSSPRHVKAPKHVCFVILHQIGDVVMSLPTVEAIVAMTPQAKHSIIVGKAPASLLTTNPWGAEIHVFDATWQKVVRQFSPHATASQNPKNAFHALLNQINPDTVVVFHPDLVVNQLLGQTQIPHTFGFINAGGGFRLTHPITMPQTGHQIERNFSLAQAVATTFQASLPQLTKPYLIPNEKATQTIIEKLQETDIQPSRLIVLHPFASAATKNWSFERWQELITWFIQQNYQPVIIGGKDDQFPNELPKEAVSWCGKLSLPETIALVSQAKLFVGIDSGPGHIATAVGCPTLSIFSSVNDPMRWAPQGRDNVTILHVPVEDRKQFPYELREIPQGIKGNPYSDGITSAMVIHAVEKLI